jgi:hypothetical protein
MPSFILPVFSSLIEYGDENSIMHFAFTVIVLTSFLGFYFFGGDCAAGVDGGMCISVMPGKVLSARRK